MVLCRLDELADRESRGFDPHGRGRDTMFVVRRGAEVHGWLNACPHHGTPLPWRRHAYLNAARDRIVCAAHGALFEIESGQCTLGPCLGQGLTRVPVGIDGQGQVIVVDSEVIEGAGP